MKTDKSLYRIALTQIKGIGVMHARTLMQEIGDEEAIFKEDIRKLEAIPRISRRLINEIRDPSVLKKAEREMEFVENNRIRLLFFTEKDYPQRLNQCVDAPILLYAKGNTDFNHKKTISVIGTRNATRLGETFCQEFVKTLSIKIPDVQIISGLAYGIDICAHRAALKHNLSTVAVLAHGMDRIYPQLHRQTAIEMLQNGALLTEFPNATNPDKHNFVKRNRIVAGMADAVVVIESPEKGGSLTTADIANSYFREVFALPGRINDKMSTGCNKLISENKALLLESTDRFITQMGWQEIIKKPIPLQQELFPNFTHEESEIFEKLSKVESIHVNTLSIELNIPIAELFLTLLEMEVKNIVTAQPGGIYRLTSK